MYVCVCVFLCVYVYCEWVFYFGSKVFGFLLVIFYAIFTFFCRFFFVHMRRRLHTQNKQKIRNLPKPHELTNHIIKKYIQLDKP